MASVKQIFQKFISDKFPKKQTNIFWQLFNGIDAVLEHFEVLLKTYKRERNFLTATTLISLRNLAAQNGFEPQLKIPSRGVLSLKVNPKLFNRVGYPLYLPPYSVFKNKTNKLSYYFDSNKSMKIENDIVYIPVVEGEIVSKTYTSGGSYIERFFINTDSIANGSLSISIGIDKFTEVKSFFDNENLYDNKQFIVKYSNRQDSPIVVYVKGTNKNDVVNVSYRITTGEFGNIDYKAEFETQAILNSLGDVIDIADDEITILNNSGFNFGSNGSDINSLKSAIGFNHGANLLFDSTSYSEFILRYSNILLQKIVLNPEYKTINNIYVSKRQYINIELKNLIKEQYKKIIDSKSYLLSSTDLSNLDSLIENNEFALSSHNLFNSDVNKFALQILFNNQYELDKFSKELQDLIYINFGYFLYDKYYVLNLEVLFNDFMKENNINFEYTVFNQEIENKKIVENKEIVTNYVIKHEDKLPILRGDFDIIDSQSNKVRLFFDINIVSKENL